MAKNVDMSTVRLEVATVTTAPAFRVTDEGNLVGDLKVSVGGVFWRPRSYQQYYHLTWEAVDEVFKAKGAAKTVGEYNITEPSPGSFEDF